MWRVVQRAWKLDLPKSVVRQSCFPLTCFATVRLLAILLYLHHDVTSC